MINDRIERRLCFETIKRNWKRMCLSINHNIKESRPKLIKFIFLFSWHIKSPDIDSISQTTLQDCQVILGFHLNDFVGMFLGYVVLGEADVVGCYWFLKLRNLHSRNIKLFKKKVISYKTETCFYRISHAILSVTFSNKARIKWLEGVCLLLHDWNEHDSITPSTRMSW